MSANGSRFQARKTDPVSSPSSASYDERRRLVLSRNRMLATGLLAAMGGVYVGTHFVSLTFASLLVRAGAEAGLVGGLADWFAVTALFRHPLGLPIPHTAIVPTNKEKIAQALSRFVEQHFLTRELLVRKVRELEVGKRAAHWLASPATAPTIANWVIMALPPLIRALDDPKLREFVNRTLGYQLRNARLAPGLSRLLRILSGTGEAEALFDSVLDGCLGWLGDNKQQIVALVRERSRWWIPKIVDQKIAAAIIEGIGELLKGLRDPNGDARVKFRSAMSRLIDDLLNSPERLEQIEKAKERLLTNPEVKAWLVAVWREISQSVLEDLKQPSSATRQALEHAVRSIGAVLARDGGMMGAIDIAAERIALIAFTQRHKIASVVDEVIRSWDTPTVIDRLELAVGSDLQYIRMNGTLVGAAVGCLIFVVSWLLGGLP
jgi:uncharacterized membrane-anchored protein YjiN (DUF445 family)